jgi:hypothetical protein
MNKKTWKLSPSDFAFLWEECKRCFYLKAMGFYRPRQMFPKIFNIIDQQIKICFQGQRIEKLITDIPGGSIKYSDEWVESLPIEISGTESKCYILGKFDSIINFDDQSYGVIDFKTSEISENQIEIYSRQLHAYAYALENPAPQRFSCNPISKLGLIIYEPKIFSCVEKDKASLHGNIKWFEIKRNDTHFLDFLHDVVTVLDQPEAPDPSPTCEWCKYRESSRSLNF